MLHFLASHWVRILLFVVGYGGGLVHATVRKSRAAKPKQYPFPSAQPAEPPIPARFRIGRDGPTEIG